MARKEIRNRFGVCTTFFQSLRAMLHLVHIVAIVLPIYKINDKIDSDSLIMALQFNPCNCSTTKEQKTHLHVPIPNWIICLALKNLTGAIPAPAAMKPWASRLNDPSLVRSRQLEVFSGFLLTYDLLELWSASQNDLLGDEYIHKLAETGQRPVAKEINAFDEHGLIIHAWHRVCVAGLAKTNSSVTVLCTVLLPFSHTFWGPLFRCMLLL